MSGRIFLLNDNAKLLPMVESPYDSESLLQGLLADHPDLLAGEQINSEEPRRWLLVAREMSVPDDARGSPRWSLDHLFLDQDAIPTLVEVKRSSDTRIRREVVGQMLDYAANAVVYWPVEEVRAKFEGRCQTNDEDPTETLGVFLGEDHEPDQFWQRVKTNLQAGRIRMVFVADSVPAELQRVVEFLNGQMDPAEVIAIEVRKFTGEGMTTLVPRVLGQTEAAKQKKLAGTTSQNQWDEISFFDALQQQCNDTAIAIARKCLKWATSRGLTIWWGRGAIHGGFIPMYKCVPLFRISIRGRVEIQFQHMKLAPFDDKANRSELAKRLATIAGVTIADDKLTKRPAFDIALLSETDALDKFLSVLDWVVSELESANP